MTRIPRWLKSTRCAASAPRIGDQRVDMIQIAHPHIRVYAEHRVIRQHDDFARRRDHGLPHLGFGEIFG